LHHRSFVVSADAAGGTHADVDQSNHDDDDDELYDAASVGRVDGVSTDVEEEEEDLVVSPTDGLDDGQRFHLAFSNGPNVALLPQIPLATAEVCVGRMSHVLAQFGDVMIAGVPQRVDLAAVAIIGRVPECDVRINVACVSKKHVCIEYGDLNGAVITNLSSNPLWVNGAMVETKKPIALAHMDVIELAGEGSTRFVMLVSHQTLNVFVSLHCVLGISSSCPRKKALDAFVGVLLCSF
jgi:hypothetical protein